MTSVETWEEMEPWPLTVGRLNLLKRKLSNCKPFDPAFYGYEVKALLDYINTLESELEPDEDWAGEE